MNIEKHIKRKQHVKQGGNLHQLAEITKTLGDLYFENDEPRKALQEYTEQLSLCEVLQDKLNCAIAHRMIGEIHTILGDHEQALVHQNLYLAGARDTKSLIEEQRAFATLGRTYLCLAESLIADRSEEKRDEALTSAEAAFVQSMQLCDKLEGTVIRQEEKMLMRARLLLNLGLTLEARKETQQAIDLMEKAIALCKSNNFQEDLHRTYISLTVIYKQKGNYELALNYIEPATASNAPMSAEARITKAELLMQIGQWNESRKILISLYKNSRLPRDICDQVERYLRIVVSFCRAKDSLLVETDAQTKLKLYETLGDAAVAVECFDQGAEYYQRMLTCAEETGDQIFISLTSLARTLKDAGRYEEALPFARRELELCANPRERCKSAQFLANLLIETHAADVKIREYYTLALSSANESDNVELQKSVTKEFVRYLESVKQFDEASDIKRKAGLTSETLSDAESEASCEESERIGADICLEDLSDLEVEEHTKGPSATRRRAKRASAAIRRNEKGETQLHVACINGDISGVERLLSCGHSTNVRDHYGWAPLHEAANHGYLEIAELLLKHDANVSDPGGASCKGMTPLHDAASCGHLSMMQLLMQYGANVTLRTHDGDTVLDCLEDWRSRVEDLSPEDSVEYDIMRRKLAAVIPVKKRSKRSDGVETLEEKSARSEPREMSAGEDYKRTIANLRSFNKINTTAAFKSGNNIAAASLVNEEQVLLDDWLEDDIGSTVKKKFTSNNCVTMTSKRKSTDESVHNIAKRSKINDTFEDGEDFSVGGDSDDDEVVQLLEEPRRIRRKRQAFLVSSGFTRSSITTSPASSPVHSSSSSLQTSAKQHNKDYACPRISVKEKVFDLRVEVCEDEQEFLTRITTSAERMFFDETGCTVELQLRPVNGNIVTEDILRNASDKLECEIVQLQVPSVTERYKTICRTRNSTICEIVLRCLKSCENTSMCRMKPDNVDKDTLVSLLKTLEYERDLKLLQLSGVALQAAGAHLRQCLSNLSSLQELYLKGCDIDYACLRQINALPSQLKVLDLSYNPLNSASRDVLQKLIAPLRHLQTLNLRYCKLENFCLSLDNPNLTNCDISWNKLNRDAMTSFLSRQLFDLNLSNIVSSSRFILSLNTVGVTLSPSLECLELSFCDITDSDVKIILTQLPRLLKLTLSGNANVSVSSVNMLLSRQPTLTYIDVSGCKSIASGPEAGLIIQNPEVCTLLASIEPDLCESWIKLWRGAGVVMKLPHNLAIFKSI